MTETPQTPETPKKRSGSYSENRKQALVTYLAALFGVAFLIVLISLIIQVNHGSANTSAEKVEAMQAQIKDLQSENASLLEALAGQSDDATAQQLQEYQDQIRSLQQTILSMSENSEYLESNANDASIAGKQLDALTWLAKAQNAYISQDADTLRSAMAQLEDGLYEYLDSESLNAYYLLLEYMEQPYIGE